MAVSDSSHLSQTSQPSQLAQNSAHLRRSRVAIIASVMLWLAMFAGNIALYAARPASHWPMLESIEALQAASLIPVALILHRLNRGAPLSVFIATLGIAAMAALAAIGVGFATELVTFSKGPIGGIGYYVCWLVMLGWLLGVNALAWRLRTLPRSVAAFGMATAATATLLYPIWALRLLHALSTIARD